MAKSSRIFRIVLESGFSRVDKLKKAGTITFPKLMRKAWMCYLLAFGAAVGTTVLFALAGFAFLSAGAIFLASGATALISYGLAEKRYYFLQGIVPIFAVAAGSAVLRALGAKP